MPEPRRISEKANLPEHHEHIHFAATLHAALARASELVGSPEKAAAQEPSPSPPPPSSPLAV